MELSIEQTRTNLHSYITDTAYELNMLLNIGGNKREQIDYIYGQAFDKIMRHIQSLPNDEQPTEASTLIVCITQSALPLNNLDARYVLVKLCREVLRAYSEIYAKQKMEQNQ